MITTRLNAAIDNFKSTYRFTPNFKLEKSSIAQVASDNGSMNVNVLNLFNLKDGEYKFKAMGSSDNGNKGGTIVIANGVVTAYTDLYPKGEQLNDWIIEEFEVDGVNKHYPIAAWGEYPIFVEPIKVKLKASDIDMSMLDAPIKHMLIDLFNEVREVEADVEDDLVYVDDLLGFDIWAVK